MKLLIGIVHYGDSSKTSACIETVRSQKIPVGNEVQVVVVDNSKNYDCAFEGEYSVMNPHSNIGYGAALNNVFFYHDCDYFMILNNDALLMRGFIQNLFNIITKIKVDILCPVVYDGDAEIIYSGGKVDRTGPVHSTEEIEGIVPTAFVYGCCAIFSEAAFSELLFDTDYFLYFEDADLSLRAIRSGFRIYAASYLRVVHDKDTARSASPYVRYYQARNIFHMMKKLLSLDAFLVWLLYYFAVFIPKRVVYFALKGKFETVAYILRGVVDVMVGKTGRIKA